MDGCGAMRSARVRARRDETGRNACVCACSNERRKDRVFVVVIVGRRSSRRGRSSVNSFIHSFIRAEGRDATPCD
jgi:hypothetical protein